MVEAGCNEARRMRECRWKLLIAGGLLTVSAIANAQDARHQGHDTPTIAASKNSMPKESGQAAFAAIREIVAVLEADPNTDWSKVDIDALRAHLVDMENVTMSARVTGSPVAGGMQFQVIGDGPVRDSIRRMTRSHATMTNGRYGWHTAVADTPGGASMTVTSDTASDAPKIRALGFFGIMTIGVHHQLHHLMMAKGVMVQ